MSTNRTARFERSAAENVQVEHDTCRPLLDVNDQTSMRNLIARQTQESTGWLCTIDHQNAGKPTVIVARRVRRFDPLLQAASVSGRCVISLTINRSHYVGHGLPRVREH